MGLMRSIIGQLSKLVKLPLSRSITLQSCLAKAYMIPQMGGINYGPITDSSSATQSHMISDHASVQEAERTSVIPKLSTLTQTLIQNGEDSM